MTDDTSQPRIAINVMRARQTVVGFLIAVDSFQLSFLSGLSGGVKISGHAHPIHIAPDTALYLAVALALASLFLLTISSDYNEQGTCSHWQLIGGDILLYLSMAQTVSGFFSPLGISVMDLQQQYPLSAESLGQLRLALLAGGGVCWFLATYVGPATTIVRSPYPARVNALLAFAYVVLLLAVCYVSWLSGVIDRSPETGSNFRLTAFLLEFVQPLRWR